MSLLTAVVPRRANLHRMLVGIGIFFGVIAVLPIVFGLFSGVGDSSSRTAFASAPPGNYAVFTAAGETEDAIRVASATDPGDASVVATIGHLPGYVSRGAVSPDGRQLALVVADGGTQANPVASLQHVDLETGEVTRLLAGIPYLQDPAWAPGSDAVIATVERQDGPVDVLSVPLDGSAHSVLQSADALGIYPIAYDPEGRLVSVVLDARGSTVTRDGQEVAMLSPSLTRDWSLSPDGTSLSFVETDTTSGVHYLARVVELEGARVTAQAAQLDQQALGSTWSPDGGPTFGLEPLDSAGGDGDAISAQAQSLGFDVPLGYSADGKVLAVQHWSGDSFDDPGDAAIEIVVDGARTPLPGASRFYGWAAR